MSVAGSMVPEADTQLRSGMQFGYMRACRRRRALAMTVTELKLIAALAIIGLRSRPKTG